MSEYVNYSIYIETLKCQSLQLVMAPWLKVQGFVERAPNKSI